MHLCLLLIWCFEVLCVQPPQQWEDLISSGKMVWSPHDLLEITPGVFPAIANGNLGLILGPRQWWKNSWPWRDSGNIHLAGVYNGESFKTPSHRAQIPSLVDSFILRDDPHGNYTPQGMGLYFRQGTVYNRTIIDAQNCRNTLVEQRYYAHRRFSSVLVYEIEAQPFDPHQPWSGCQLSFFYNLSTWTPDLNVTVHTTAASTSSPIMWSASTLIPEEPGLPLRKLGVVFSSWISDLAKDFPKPGKLHFSTSTPIWTAVATFRSDLDSSTPLASALQDWLKYSSLSSSQLFESHVSAWSELWESGVEITGNGSFAATVNASLYDIYSSLRPEVQFSTSPGGLAGGSYCGHTFWDMETWMFPVLTVLQPPLAKMAASYRLARNSASEQRATDNDYNGSFWVWESAFTGLDTAPCRDCDLFEQHISADIMLGTCPSPFLHNLRFPTECLICEKLPRTSPTRTDSCSIAWRFYYLATQDIGFLKSVWGSIFNTCTFWECRFQQTDATNAPPPEGWGKSCAPKNGKTGNWTIHGVMCPDESSGVVNDSAYTNAAAGKTLEFCISAAEVLGESHRIPKLWKTISQNIYLPLTTKLDPSGPVHQEYTGFEDHFHLINQADVALLQYPLGLSFPRDLMLRDLDYWSSVTVNGMFTGDASYSIAYLALGERKSADASLQLAFTHLEPNFLVFTEIPYNAYRHGVMGGTQHFITGAGGYLQNFVFGYPGLRIHQPGVLSFTSQRPILPPHGITAVTLRSIHLMDSSLTVYYNNTHSCVEVLHQQNNLDLSFDGSVIPLVVKKPVCILNGPFEIMAKE